MLGNKGMQICFIRKLNQTITAVTLKKAAPLANSDAAKYEAEKKSANDDFQKASTYLEEAVALSPERAEIAKVLGQVKAAM